MGGRQHLGDLTAAAKRIDATDPPPRTLAQDAAAVRAEAADPKLVEKAVLAMLPPNSDEHSLGYASAFLQGVGKAGSGSTVPVSRSRWLTGFTGTSPRIQSAVKAS